ncbi:putative SAC3/GANP/THP3 domain-containing protein [Septoria linicola]|nr:putative SAC3/GANP/THP3 domain-containing protein [Septoria linicola]
MSTGRARGRGRGGVLAAPRTTMNGAPTGPARGRGGRVNSGMRPASNATRGGFGTNGRASPFTANKIARGNASKQASRTGSASGGASATAGSAEMRYQALKTARDQERKDAIRQGLMSDPNKPMKLSEAITPVGICQSMCAEFERLQRVVQRDVWDEEKIPNFSPDASPEESVDESRMVKKFRRSAAGDEAQLPSDLRPPAVLKKTCDYLFHDILSEAKLPKVHHFVWDRTRAIRNDFSIQQLSKADDLSIAIECFERIARFHILSLHQLALEEKPYSAYDPKQEREQLDKTLLSLMQYYEDCRGRIPLPNEAEFRAYCVLFQLQDATPDLEDRVQSWPRNIGRDQRVQQALKVYAAACNTWDAQGPFTGADRTPHVIARHDWESFWQLVKSPKVSYLMACVAEIYFNVVRKMVLSGIIRITRVKGTGNTEWTLSSMAKLFYFDDDQQLEDFCARFGLEFQDLDSGEDRYLDISRVTNRTLPQEDAGGPAQLKSYLVESKRERRALSAVIDGLSVRQAREQGMIAEEADEDYEEDMNDAEVENGVENEEDEEDTLFVPEAKKEEVSAVPKLSFGQPTSTSPFGRPSSTAPSVFGQPSSTPSIFGQPSSAPSAFGQPSSTASPFSKPSNGFGQPSQSANPFASVSAKPAESNLFKTTPAAPSPLPATAPTSTVGLEITSPPTTSGEKETSKSVFGIGNTFGQTPASSAPSLFAPKPAVTPTDSAAPSLFASKPAATPTESVSAAPSLFAPKQAPNAISAESSGTTTPSAPAPALTNPFASGSSTFTFPPLTSTEQKPLSPPLEQKTTSQLGQPFGAAASAPSQPVQSETKLNPPPQSPTQPHPPTSNSPSQAPPTSPQAGSSSPPRRPSAFDTKPKRPSPLSISFTASEETPADSAPTQTSSEGLKPPQRELFPQRQLQPSTVAPSRTVSTAAEFDAIITRLAKELVEDPTTGYLQQYIDFCVRSLVTEVQEKVYFERITKEADDFRQFSLEDKYGKRWREISRTRRLRRQQKIRRERQQRRLRASQDQDMGNSVSVIDTSSRHSSRAASTTAREKPNKQAAVDAMFRSTNGGSRFGADKQARAGSKRSAESIDSGSVTSLREIGHKRAKSTSHTNGSESTRVQTTTGGPDPDVLKRSSFLGFSLAGDGAHDTSTSTTKSTYFRMKAMGLKPTATASTGAERGVKRSRSESLDAASAKLNTSSLARLDNNDQDRALMPPPSARSVRSKPDDDDEALFARLRAAREALKEGEGFMRSEIARKDGLHRSRSASQSDGESPSLERARAEARLRSSHNSDFGVSVSNREVPAYRLRESRFVPREQYSKAIERANEIRASRSVPGSRPASRTEERETDTPSTQAVPNPAQTPSKSHSHDFESSLGQSQANSSSAGTLSQPARVPADTGPTSTFGASTGFGFSSHAATVRPNDWGTVKAPNPFSQSSSFASAVNTGSNPFLQTRSQDQVNGPFQGTTSSHDVQTTQLSGFSGFSQPSHNQSSLEQRDTTLAQQQTWGFTTAPEELEQTQDHTIQPDHIPDALSASFGQHASANSYMPSQAASAAISLLSNNEDEAPASNSQPEENEAYGQADIFNQVNAAAQVDDMLDAEDDGGQDDVSIDNAVGHQTGYAGKFAALAEYDDEEDEEDQSAFDEDDVREQHPTSYLNATPLAEEELDDDDEEDVEDGESDLPNGRYMGEYPDEEEGYADGDVEDEGDFDEDGEDYDEEEEDESDAEPGMYANAYQNQYGRQAYAAPPKPQVNEALQKVGNDENEPIELSD